MNVPECAFRSGASRRIMLGDYKARSSNVNLICNELARAVAPLPDCHDLSIPPACSLLRTTFDLALFCLTGNDIGADSYGSLSCMAALKWRDFEANLRRLYSQQRY